MRVRTCVRVYLCVCVRVSVCSSRTPRALRIALLVLGAGADVEDVFSLNFAVVYESWGEKKVHELRPGGEALPVTSSNKKVRGCWARVRTRKRACARLVGVHALPARTSPALWLARAA